MVARKSDVFDKTFRRGTIYNNSTKGIPCNTKPVLPWMHGEAIYNALKKVNFEGLTGHVQFDDRGQRTNYTLDIISVTQDIGLSKIGRWHSDYGILANDDTPNGTPGVDQGNFTDEVYPWDIIVTTLLVSIVSKLHLCLCLLNLFSSCCTWPREFERAMRLLRRYLS
ncbi:glutamate receptor subunit protein glur5 precursor [Plakobranchus ocellatus]|uniref:Glutamate receptor subunit protein glur5 n=1 Tax=Plakobranchus ocellatus TaxID=259542 RepID=A0AAV3XX36_9GAST|nr:glutamate receptor subunit protein glur5 precursor [Plakobranchus ocellatus]